MPTLLRRALVPFVLLLALPGAAAAAPSVLLSATGGKVRGYSLTATAVGGSAYATLLRTKGTGYEAYSVRADRGVSYRPKRNLSRATLRAALGRYGRLSLTFHATGPAFSGKLSPICRGSAPLLRKGFVTGTYRLRIDARYFRTIRRRSMAATLSKSTGLVTCTGPVLTAEQPLYTLTTTARTASSAVLTASRLTDGKVRETVTAIRQRKGVTLTRTITVTTAGGAFGANAALTAATVRGAGGFMSGKLIYAGHPGGASQTTGTLRGAFAAKFAVGGRAHFRAGTRATLARNLAPR